MQTLLIKLLPLGVALAVAACGDVSVAPTNRGACLAAQEMIRERLVSPATAKFQPCRDQQVTHSGTEWRVTGYVDSQNRFGATIRSSYTATLEPRTDGVDGWLVWLESLTSR